MPIIDAHVHLYPPEVNRDPAGWAAACGESHWAELCTRQRKNGQAVQGFPSVDKLLHDMDAAGMGQGRAARLVLGTARDLRDAEPVLCGMHQGPP